MSYTPCCVICQKPITWTFYLCKEHEAEYGKRVEDWPDWLRYMIREENMVRWHLTDPRSTQFRLEYLEELRTDMAYSFDIEDFVETRMDFAGYVTTDGIALEDSDWDAVFVYTI